ncbi:histidine phosphatase family protein [Kytococcus sedentarius]|uniref:SixA phosphatase family protein n=1 Tax=Kytococcus sedentarius TaxID=1276 RepID=UPI0035BC7136
MGERTITRQLAVVRHGQAQPAPPGGADIQRALTTTGEQEARAAGQRLASMWGTLDLVLHSPAVRTTQTWQTLATELPELPAEQVWPTRDVYEATVPDLLAALGDVPEECQRVLLVGHAPGIPALVGHLTGGYPQGWSTGQVGVIDLPAGLPWADLYEGCGTRIG